MMRAFPPPPTFTRAVPIATNRLRFPFTNGSNILLLSARWPELEFFPLHMIGYLLSCRCEQNGFYTTFASTAMYTISNIPQTQPRLKTHTLPMLIRMQFYGDYCQKNVNHCLSNI